MMRLSLFAAVGLFFLTPLSLHAQAQPFSNSVNALMDQNPSLMLHAKVILPDGSVAYEKNANTPVHPASALKLFTTSSALDTLGSDYTIRTSVYAAKQPVAGIIDGDLVLYGRGDPTLMPEHIAHLASQIASQGITRINGNIIGDHTYFIGLSDAQVNALTVHENIFGIRIAPGKRVGAKGIIVSTTPANIGVPIVNTVVTGRTGSRYSVYTTLNKDTGTVTISGSVPLRSSARINWASIQNPSLTAAKLLKAELSLRGVIVLGGPQTKAAPHSSGTTNIKKYHEIAYHESKPLSDIVTETNKRSVNVFANNLLSLAGKSIRDSGDTKDNGISILNRYIKSLGVKSKTFTITDGSGLSDDQALTASTIADLIYKLHRTEEGKIVIQSLPIAGIDGTLKERFLGTRATGTVRAKTSTLATIDGLSGVLTRPDGSIVSFSFIISHNPGIGQGKKVLDQIILLLVAHLGTG